MHANFLRWDDEETETLPECMKLCLRILYNTIKDIASQIEEEYGWVSVSSYLQGAVLNSAVNSQSCKSHFK